MGDKETESSQAAGQTLALCGLPVRVEPGVQFGRGRRRAAPATRTDTEGQITAVTVISMRAPAGRAGTCTVVLPGGVTLKYSA